MGIKYYPNRIYRALPSVVDAITKKHTVLSLKGVKDISSIALSEVVSPLRDWKIVGIKFTFDSATARDYSVVIVGGRSVIENLNDFLWLQTNRTLPQKITLSPGFYTGTELATELQTKLNANSAFTALALTFTVAYASATGLFTITPSTGLVRYLEHNTAGTLPNQYSIAGHLFGLNVTTSFVTPLISDTVVSGLNSQTFVIDETASSDLTFYNNDIHTLSMDEAILVETSVAGVVVDYSIDYQDISNL